MSEAIERKPIERHAAFALGGLACVVGVVALVCYWTRPPQMGTSEDAFNTVDALYTAVRSKDEKRVAQCEDRLKGYRAAGKLPAAAAEALDAIIATARAGSWNTATRRLYDFMLAQRREGTLDHGRHATKAAGQGKK